MAGVLLNETVDTHRQVTFVAHILLGHLLVCPAVLQVKAQIGTCQGFVLVPPHCFGTLVHAEVALPAVIVIAVEAVDFSCIGAHVEAALFCERLVV